MKLFQQVEYSKKKPYNVSYIDLIKIITSDNKCLLAVWKETCWISAELLETMHEQIHFLLDSA